MAISLSSAKTAAGAITVPALVLSFSSAALLVFLILPLLALLPHSNPVGSGPAARSSSSGGLQISTTPEGVQWLKSQILRNSLLDPPTTPEAWHQLRKGINPPHSSRILGDTKESHVMRRCRGPYCTSLLRRPTS